MSTWQGYDLIKAGAAGLDAVRAPLDGHPNRLVSYADPALGVIYVIGRGVWDEAVVDAHFAELARTAAFVRRQVSTVRVLVDLRPAAVQTLSIARQIRLHTKALWSDQDRIAVVVNSAPSETPPGNQRTFGSMAAARAWLGLAPGSDAAASIPPFKPAGRAIAAAR